MIYYAQEKTWAVLLIGVRDTEQPPIDAHSDLVGRLLQNGPKLFETVLFLRDGFLFVNGYVRRLKAHGRLYCLRWSIGLNRFQRFVRFLTYLVQVIPSLKNKPVLSRCIEKFAKT